MHETPEPSDAPVAAVLLEDEPDIDAEGDVPVDDRLVARAGRWWRSADLSERIGVGIDAVIVVAAMVFVLAQLAPGLLVADTTPAGGDMGAHVWGPAYLRDHLLPSGRLAGWTPDWYAGFPAYQFYMVVPALLIVALNAGFQGWAALVPLAVAAALVVAALLHHSRRVRRTAAVAAILIAVVGAGVPYGVAFKWVSVLGLVSLPLIAYVTGRLADLPFPGPALLTVGSVLFLFNREPTTANTGNIIGGNVASTLAGEFSFSISLALCVLYLAFLLRGLRTGRHRALCAVLLALTGVCHIIPAIYAAMATAVAVLVSGPWTRPRLRWLLPVLPVAGLLTAFWALPFVLRRPFLNDMGWEKLPGANQSWLDFLAPQKLWWVILLAAVGATVSIVLRIRFGMFLAINAVLTIVAFMVVPQGRLWNARLLPFLLLCVYLLAALAVAELGRAIAALVAVEPARPVHAIALATPVVAALAAGSFAGLYLGVLPGTTTATDGGYQWAGLHVSAGDRNVVRDWARWNYSGYERKAAYPEYHALIQTMQGVGERDGCGRAMWEYDNERLNTYGTPMAPMLLPFWTDGCIGSMEGLYFEASATTPYHFLNQRALSTNCSCAQRDLPYGSFDNTLGIQQLQLMGVRYYLAFTEGAVAAADANTALTPIATSPPWHVYEVAESALVQPLLNEPAVVEGITHGRDWLGPATKFFSDPSRWNVLLAADGPADWERIEVCEATTAPVPGTPEAERFRRLDVCTTPAATALPGVTVTEIRSDTDSITFDVSQVGVPVLVKASYFPNWEVAGAEGPYRVAPNLMVVVPTATHVELTYGWTGLDVAAYLLTLLGIVGAVILARRAVVDPGRVWLDGPDPVLGLTAPDNVGPYGFVSAEPELLPASRQRTEDFE